MAARLKPEEIQLLEALLAKAGDDYDLSSLSRLAEFAKEYVEFIQGGLMDLNKFVEEFKSANSIYRLMIRVVEVQGKSDYLIQWFNNIQANNEEAYNFLEGLIDDFNLVRFISDPKNLAESNYTGKSARVKLNFAAMEAFEFWKALHDIADTRAADIRSSKDVARELRSRGYEDYADTVLGLTNYGSLPAELNRQARSGEADVFFENDEMPDDWVMIPIPR